MLRGRVYLHLKLRFSYRHFGIPAFLTNLVPDDSHFLRRLVFHCDVELDQNRSRRLPRCLSIHQCAKGRVKAGISIPSAARTRKRLSSRSQSGPKGKAKDTTTSPTVSPCGTSVTSTRSDGQAGHGGRSVTVSVTPKARRIGAASTSAARLAWADKPQPRKTAVVAARNAILIVVFMIVYFLLQNGLAVGGNLAIGRHGCHSRERRSITRPSGRAKVSWEIRPEDLSHLRHSPAERMKSHEHNPNHVCWFAVAGGMLPSAVSGRGRGSRKEVCPDGQDG